MYNGDIFRAKQGVSRHVPGLKYAHIVGDSWTHLIVLSAKIMQVSYDNTLFNIFVYYSLIFIATIHAGCY